jgi:hypothetical protein
MLGKSGTTLLRVRDKDFHQNRYIFIGKDAFKTCWVNNDGHKKSVDHWKASILARCDLELYSVFSNFQQIM